MYKIKIYKLGISKTFQKTHKRAGEPTDFKQKIENNFIKSPLEGDLAGCDLDCKLHTIRNGKTWKERIEEVKNGRAILVIYQWSGKPYNSEHNDLFVFRTKELNYLDVYNRDVLIIDADNLGWQEITFQDKIENPFLVNSSDSDYEHKHLLSQLDYKQVAKNDGLSADDFKNWFKTYDLNEIYTIIHFTNFRYT